MTLDKKKQYYDKEIKSKGYKYFIWFLIISKSMIKN
jgi:hypothetical protein